MQAFALSWVTSGDRREPAGLPDLTPCQLPNGLLFARPLHRDPQRRVTISGRLRLDNRPELAAALGLSVSTPEMELLAAGWRKWERDLAEHLRGPFAIAVHDEVSGELCLARDSFGLEPFYYALIDGNVVAAGDPVSLRAMCETAPARNAAMIADFIKGQVVSHSETYYEGIFRLPPGHRASLKDGRFTVERYWSAGQPERGIDPSDAAARFRELFDRSVAACADTRGRIALPLSGGLDSSSIAGSLFSNGAGGRDIVALSMTFYDTPGWSDGQHIEQLLESFGLEGHFLPSDRHDPLQNIEQQLAIMDGPMMGYGRSVSNRMFAMAQDLGAQTMLHGHGGDEIVSYGLGRLNELAKDGQWLSLWRECKAAAPLSGFTPLATFLPYLDHSRSWRRLRGRLARWKPAKGEAAEAISPIAPAIEATLDPERYVSRDPGRRADHDERILHEYILENPIQAHSLETLTLAARANGLDLRMPFYSRDLAEFSLSLASHHKLDRGRTRAIMRRAMANRLPDSVLYRTDKFNFFPVFANGLLKDEERLRELVGPANGQLGEFVNGDWLKSLWARVSQAGTSSQPVDLFALWRIATLAIWLKMDSQPTILAEDRTFHA